MATGYTNADRLPAVEDFDYTKSHRSVPIPTVAHAAPAAEGYAPHSIDQPGRPREREEAGSVHTAGRRRGSFSSFLRSGSSHRQERAPPLPSAPSMRQAHPEPSVDGNSHRDPTASSSTTSTKHDRTFSFGSRKSSGDGGKMFRKSSGVSKMRQQQQQEQEQERLTALAHQVPKQPPHLPSLNPLPTISTFGGEDARPDSVAIFNTQYTTDPHQHQHQHPLPRQSQPGAPANFSRPGNAAMPASSYNSSSSPAYAIRQGNAFAQAAASSSPSVTGKSTNGEYAADSSHRSESMTNRGRYSYASSTAQVNVNSPRRVRRRKDPTPFNALVIGAKNSGKTSFISFLRHSLAMNSHTQPYTTEAPGNSPGRASKTSFTSHFQETEMDGERIGVTLWDSAGLEQHIIDLQLREMAAFVESKFEETFVEEQKVMRSPGVKDTHIHCVFLVLDPVRLDSTIAASSAFHKGGAGLANASGLDDDLDLQVMRALWGKTTVIPVISKADTLTLGHMSFLKRAVWDSLKDAKLDPLEALELEGDEEDEDDDDDTLDEEDEDEEEAHGHRKRDRIDNLDEGSEGEEEDDSDAPVPKSKRNGHARQSSLAATVSSATGDELPYLPMSILSPDPYDLPPFTKLSRTETVGRRFPWGFADPYKPEHCDFTRLRDSIFSEWRGDLRELARTKWYENWRTSRLKNLPGSRQRVKGGVTPVAAVPREGRGSLGPMGVLSGGGAQAGAAAQAAAAVPRSVAGSTGVAGGDGQGSGGGGNGNGNGNITSNGDGGGGGGGSSVIGVAMGSPTLAASSVVSAPAGGGGGGGGGAQRNPLSKAERMMGMSASDAQSVVGASRSGSGSGSQTYRGVETYQ
ncbi:hypothetical protein LTR36_009071 [Oleoguttula mirabilis]|uniref:Septin-type G domain-containing protein n=1 Tax=Oleoguttula mirabilis TaxID=1507867 RepID=A0AAV9J7H5_9PEZI|nr:hypothetical protein LTR36_009071 [Oleoguttula mirabilis]